MKFGDDIMWLIVMFDLPTHTKAEKTGYVRFRKHLLDSGYTMMQYSVYMRHCATFENTQTHINRVKKALPAFGEVRILKISDTQFGKIEVYFGNCEQEIEKPGEQLVFF